MLNASVRFPPIIQNDRDRETGNYNSPPYGSLSLVLFLFFFLNCKRKSLAKNKRNSTGTRWKKMK
jgi:hypothetical protein